MIFLSNFHLLGRFDLGRGFLISIKLLYSIIFLRLRLIAAVMYEDFLSFSFHLVAKARTITVPELWNLNWCVYCDTAGKENAISVVNAKM